MNVVRFVPEGEPDKPTPKPHGTLLQIAAPESGVAIVELVVAEARHAGVLYGALVAAGFSVNLRGTDNEDGLPHVLGERFSDFEQPVVVERAQLREIGAPGWIKAREVNRDTAKGVID